VTGHGPNRVSSAGGLAARRSAAARSGGIGVMKHPDPPSNPAGRGGRGITSKCPWEDGRGLARADGLTKAKRSGAKGVYWKRMGRSSTMGPGFKVDAASVNA